eukprot:7902072-Pyramimonas_sp.AAC.1
MWKTCGRSSSLIGKVSHSSLGVAALVMLGPPASQSRAPLRCGWRRCVIGSGSQLPAATSTI